MLIKITQNSVFDDNPWLLLDPVFSKLEDHHLRWLAFMLDPWSPARFMEPSESLRWRHTLVPSIRLQDETNRPIDADYLVWDQAIVQYAKMCPDTGVKSAIEARKNLIKEMAVEEDRKLPAKPVGHDINRHKIRLDSLHRGLMAKAIAELEGFYGKLLYKPQVTSDADAQKDPERQSTASRRAIDTMQFD